MNKIKLAIIVVVTTFCFITPIFGNPTDSLYLVAKELAQNGNYEMAKIELNKALNINKNDDKILNELAFCYFQTSNYNMALKYANRLIELKTPLSGDGYVVRCASLEAIKQPNEAIKSYRKGLELYPQNKQLNFNYSLFNLSKNELVLAEYYATQAVLIAKWEPDTHYLLYQIAIAQNSRPKALLSLTYYAHLIQDVKKSEDAYKSIIKLWREPSNSDGQKLIRQYSSNTDASGFGEIEKLISESSKFFIEKQTPDAEIEILSNSNDKLYSLFKKLDTKNKDNFWVTFYGSFYSLVSEKNYSRESTLFIAQNHHKPEVISLITKNIEHFSDFTYWLEKQLFSIE